MIVRFSFVAFIIALFVVGCAESEDVDYANVQETESAAEPVKELEEVIVEDPIEESTVEPVTDPVEDPSDKPIVEPIEEPTVDPIEEHNNEPVEEIETPIEVPVCDRVRPVPRDGYTMVFVPNSNVQYTVCANSQISEDIYMDPDSPLYCPTTCTDGPLAWFPADIDREAFDEAVCDIETNYASGGLGDAKRICERGARLSNRNGKGTLTANWYGDNTLDWGVCLPSSRDSGRSFPRNNRCKTDCDCAHQLLRGKNNPEYNDYFCHTDGYCYKGTFEEREKEIYNDIIELPSQA